VQYENGPTWTNISGATDSTFNLGAPQEGEMLRVAATPTDGATTLSASSPNTAAVKAAAPVLTIANKTPAEVDSELRLNSSDTGTGHPVATLTLTATNGASSAASQALTVVDPPSQASANDALAAAGGLG
jgi:hypothetical protein